MTQNDRLTIAAANLITHVMEQHGLTHVDQLECPHMKALADALGKGPRRERKPKRCIGVHTNADMFRGR